MIQRSYQTAISRTRDRGRHGHGNLTELGAILGKSSVFIGAIHYYWGIYPGTLLIGETMLNL